MPSAIAACGVSPEWTVLAIGAGSVICVVGLALVLALSHLL
jgi:hypothetical protein